MTVAVLTYRCPHCQKPIDVNENLIGQTVDCPNSECAMPFTLEAPSATPLNEQQSKQDRSQHLVIEEPDDEPVLAQVNPAMFRGHPLRFAVLVATLTAGLLALASGLAGQGMAINGAQLAGAGLLWMAGAIVAGLSGFALFAWWLVVKTRTLTITSERTILREGIISRDTSEVRHRDVRNLKVDQTLLQRLLGIGDLAISSSGQDDMEIDFQGAPRPAELADLIRDRQ